MVENTIKKLKEENENLKKINKLRSDLISTTSHSLRTSLSTLKWTLKMFLDDDLGKLTSTQKEYIKKLYETNDRAIDLIGEMININKIEDIALEYKLEDVDVEELIRNTLTEFGGKAHNADIHVAFLKPKEKLPAAYIDKEKIRIVLQNLIDNAIKYTNSGGKVSIRAEKKGGEIEVSVKDTGIGIAKKDQDKIFEKLVRTENAKKEAFGTGLGLYIAKNFIEGHGCKIWFESEEDKGSVFYFTIPISSKSRIK